jgi:hypothetical protein
VAAGVGEFVVPLVALAAAALLLLVGVGAFTVRRYLLIRAVGSFDCSMRRPDAQHVAGGWMPGVARYEQDRLDWFRVFTMSPRPSRSLIRGRLIILDRRVPQGPEVYAVVPGWVVVQCAYGSHMVELAMSEPAYSGLATWLESAPPGQNISIA